MDTCDKCRKCGEIGWYSTYFGSNPEHDPKRIMCNHHTNDENKTQIKPNKEVVATSGSKTKNLRKNNL